MISMVSSTQAKQRLRAARLLATPARLRVVSMLEAAKAPMTAIEVFRALAGQGIDVCPATIYRVLADLANAGVLLRAWVPGCSGTRTTYSLQGDGREARAAHRLTCGRCGHSVAFIDPGLEKRLCQAAGLHVPGGCRMPLTVTVACLGCSPTCMTRDDGARSAT
jgi:Fur family ferric uptake transcriptional regulator